MRFLDRLRSYFRRDVEAVVDPADPPPPGRSRGRVDHVVILDSTLSALDPDRIGNCGLLFRLLQEPGPQASRRLYYEPGMQWQGWLRSLALVEGRGTAPQIQRACGWLASGYREGDRIFLFGYSRGAYAVRSLGGVIDRIGLLRREAATERAVRLAWRHYEHAPDAPAARDFARIYCHAATPIEMIGVWDTVKALGLRLPGLWLLARDRHAFHNHHLGQAVRHGYQALALDETRVAFEPVLWDSLPGWEGTLEQVWFRGAHGDIGGQLGGFAAARPLANLPLVWMLERAEALGLTLPKGWRDRFPTDARAPMVGSTRSFGKAFLWRRLRRVGQDPSERLHPSVIGSRVGRRRAPSAAE